MKISIIIPTYNEASVISACIKSLSVQSYPSFEIIIVDDGSTDQTIEIISNLRKTIPLILLNQSHKGAGSARNLGAKKATGEILVFVDADMTFDRRFLKKLVTPIISGNSIGSFSKREYVSNWNNVWARCWNWNANLPDKARLPQNYPEKQKVFRAILKKSFTKVGGFTPGGYTDDWSLSEKLKIEAIAAKDAIFFHKNPDTLADVFNQSKWVAKRSYKFGFIGIFITLLRYSLPMTLITGVMKSLKHREPRFILFKCVYDIGVTIGLIHYLFTRHGAK